MTPVSEYSGRNEIEDNLAILELQILNKTEKIINQLSIN